jgi:BirA family biotin operon repressor/biotin-[acetyl-CoA-carboxylase] ligase
MNILTLSNPFGAPVYYRETVSSTMDEARLLACGGAPHGTVITAGFQEAGRGRTGRVWKMDRGQNLAFTILFRYPGCGAIPPAFTLRAGLAVSLAIEDFAPPLAGSVMVKWPNDVMLLVPPERAAYKAAGILTEAEGSVVYTGVGVNAGQREFPEDIRRKAGSIRSVLERLRPEEPEAREALFSGGGVFRLLELILLRLYRELQTLEGFSWKERLEARLYKRGELVRFAEGAAGSRNSTEGLLAGIGGGGELLLVPPGENRARPFITGELEVYERPQTG